MGNPGNEGPRHFRAGWTDWRIIIIDKNFWGGPLSMNCRPNQVKKIIVLIAGAPDIGITKNCLSWFLNHGDIWKIVIRKIACN